MNLAEWKVMLLQWNLPTHLLLIATFSLFWSFGHTPSSIEFIGDVICTQDFLLALRDKKPIDRATKYWGLGTSPLIVFQTEWNKNAILHGKGANFFHEQLKAMLLLYMSGFMKTVLKNWNRGLSGRFFSPETISKVDNIKIKRKVSLFFLPLPVSVFSFHCPPFSISCPLTWLEEGLKV